MSIKTHPLVHTLISLKGNARACVYTEPMWSIPYNLFIPYASVYMLALGVKDVQIGLITSLGLASQVVFSLLSGVITDKLGRRKTAFIFDTLSWAIPCLLWAAAQNINYFIVAALFNGIWRVGITSWTCLLVEDTESEWLVNIYTWVYISGLVAAFFTPIAGLLIHVFTLIPTMRGVYILGFIMMTTKFFLLYRFSHETGQGRIRMEETREQSVFSMLGEYLGVVRQVLSTPNTLFTIGILLVVTICTMISNTFWSVLVTERIHLPIQYLAFYPFARSGIILAFFFLVVSRISTMHFKRPMLIGFAVYTASQLLLVIVPEKNYLLLLASTFLEACGYALLNPFLDRMLAVTVDPQERARIMAIIFVVVMLITSPFGWIAGELSSINRNLPFILNIGLYVIGGILTWRAARFSEKERIILQETI
jgi:MFS family permease